MGGIQRAGTGKNKKVTDTFPLVLFISIQMDSFSEKLNCFVE